MKSRKNLSKVVVRVEELGPHGNANTICRAAILLLVSFAFGLAAPSRGYAAVRTVCASGCKYTTIAAAIAAAKAGDTISIKDAVHTESDITVDRCLTIQGQGAAKTAVDGALNGTTVFTVASGVTATFQNLTIRNGRNLSNASGGVQNEGTMTVINSIFSNNSAIASGGGIRNEGTMTVTDSTFSGNSGGGAGGGIANLGSLKVTNSTFSQNSGGASEGGGIWNEGTTTITDSTFSGNVSRMAGGIWNGGTMTITDSTLSDNSGGRGGGGILSVGRLTVINSTFFGNSAFNGGGIAGGETLTVVNSTFYGNSAALGSSCISSGGITTVINSTFLDNEGSLGGASCIVGPATVKNNILAGGGAFGNCSGVIDDAGYNISDDATCGFSATGSRNSTNPMLDPAGLQNNGGPTATIALDSESPAIDAIPLADCTDLNSNPIHTDQRGALRPDPGEVVCDIGAYEFQNFAGRAHCERKSDSALVQQYGSLSAAALAYGFSTVKALEAAVRRSCETTPVAICPPSGKGIEAPCVVTHG
jgi:predicted outer membrane repeat protein